MKKLKAIALDDEARPLNLIKLFLEDIPFVELVAAVSTLEDAEKEILYYRPDILFLDIVINGQTVFPMIESLKKRDELNFSIVFLTAYEDKYLKSAMEACSFTYLPAYLHKPLNPTKLEKMLSSYYEKIKTEDDNVYTNGTLTIKSKGGFKIVPFREIVYCESVGNLCKIALESTADKTHPLMTITLTDLDAQLPSSHFFKMSSKHIINKEKLHEANNNNQKYRSTCYMLKENGEKIKLPIPEKRWKAFKEEFDAN